MDINFRKLLLLLLPTRLRGAGVSKLLAPIVDALEQVKMEFDRFRRQTDYVLSITPQVCRMEKLLNDRYYNGNIRKTYTTDGAMVDTLYLYKNAEDKPLYVGSVPLFLDGEFGFVDGFSFVVHVPQEVNAMDDEIRAVVNSFKLIGKKFKIERYA